MSAFSSRNHQVELLAITHLKKEATPHWIYHRLTVHNEFDLVRFDRCGVCFFVSAFCTHRPASQPSEGQSLGVWVGMSLLTFKDQNVLIVHCTRPLPEGGTRKNSAERWVQRLARRMPHASTVGEQINLTGEHDPQAKGIDFFCSGRSHFCTMSARERRKCSVPGVVLGPPAWPVEPVLVALECCWPAGGRLNDTNHKKGWGREGIDWEFVVSSWRSCLLNLKEWYRHNLIFKIQSTTKLLFIALSLWSETPTW